MPRSLTKLGPLFLIIAFVGCRRTISESQLFTNAFDESVQLFLQYNLPNSMARPPGFDLEGHLRELGARWQQSSQILHSPAGVEFVIGRIYEEPDELTVLAGLQILAESHLRQAIPTLEQFSTSPSPVVAEHARRYLAESVGWP